MHLYFLQLLDIGLEKMLEIAIERYFCSRIQGYALKLKCVRGWPDRTVLMDGGIIFFVEFKTETGKLSPHQKYWKKILESLGFKYHVVRSMEECNRVIKKYEMDTP